MTVINLNRSQFLLPLLKNLVLGLTQLSSSDAALNQKVYELHHFLSSPDQVDGEALTEVLSGAKDLASSYELKRDKTPGNVTSTLPNMFYSAIAELEHMVLSKKLSETHGKPMTVAELELAVNRFYKLALHKTKIQCPRCLKVLECDAKHSDNALGEKTKFTDVPWFCPNCEFPIADQYDNIGFGGEF